MRLIIGIDSVAIVVEDEAFGNPFEIWDGCLPLHIVLNICNICSAKGMFRNFVGGVCVDKSSHETSLEKQTLTPNSLEEFFFQYLKLRKGLNGHIITN